MRKQAILFSLIFIIVLLIASCASQQKAEPYKSESTTASNLVNETGFKYTMYVGLNDKDTYKQKISDEEAHKILAGICLKYVDGFTYSKRYGEYKDTKGAITYENSLVFEFYSANDNNMKAIMNEALEKLNQESILIEKSKVDYSFYKGDGKK